MAALEVVIRNPAARRNVGQEEAENATYQEAMAALDSIMQDKARIQREIVALDWVVRFRVSPPEPDYADGYTEDWDHARKGRALPAATRYRFKKRYRVAGVCYC